MNNTQETKFLSDIHNISMTLQAIDKKLGVIMQKIEISEDEEPAKWEWSLADNGWADHKCPACGYIKNTDIHVTLSWKYCPNCGHPMIPEGSRENLDV